MTEVELFKALALVEEKELGPLWGLRALKKEVTRLEHENVALREALQSARHLIMVTTGVSQNAACIRRIDTALRG